MAMAETDRNWYIKNRIENEQYREFGLLNLRYQLAFAFMALFIGVWAVLGAIASQTIAGTTPSLFNPVLSIIILIGLLLSYPIITMWRFITHNILDETHDSNLSQLYFENELKVYDEYESSLLTQLENDLDLTPRKYPEYAEDLSKQQKISIIEKLKKHIPHYGIFFFDVISIIVMVALAFIGGLLIYFYNPLPIDKNTILILYGIFVVFWLGIVIWQLLKMRSNPKIIKEAIDKSIRG